MKKALSKERKKRLTFNQRLMQIVEAIRTPDHRAFFEFMIWPLLAIFTIGITAYSILLPAYQGEWLILFILLMIGPFLSIPWAAIIGSVTFITYGIWLFSAQMDNELTASHFILLAFMPFTPIFLSATRLKIIDIMHLATLLELPQVKAAMNISEWSLLPSHRALELRLKQHIKEYEDTKVPAVLIRFDFFEVDKLIDLLGENVVLHEVKEMADHLRKKLRTGDMIAEAIEDHSMLYVLAFPNPESDYAHALVRRLYPVMNILEFKSSMEIAIAPQDGDSLFNMKWHNIEDGKIVS